MGRKKRRTRGQNIPSSRKDRLRLSPTLHSVSKRNEKSFQTRERELRRRERVRKMRNLAAQDIRKNLEDPRRNERYIYGFRPEPVRPFDITKSLVCTARSVRREVIHAKRKAGLAGQKPPIWRKKSKIKC